jgi:hypothetical protein
MMELKNSKMLGQHDYHGWNRFSINKVKFIKLVVRFVHLSTWKKNCLPQSWKTCWNMKVVAKTKFQCWGFFFNKDFVHVKNEHCYIATITPPLLHRPFVLDRLQANVLSKQQQKHVQFVVFYLLSHGCPMSDFESLKILFQLLKVKFVSRTHWTNNFG